MFEKVLDLYDSLPLQTNEVIYTLVQSACAQLCNDRAKRIGKQMIDNLPQNLKDSDKVMNSMIFMLIKFGNVHEAEKRFNQMKHKTIFSYGAMMKGYNHNEMFEKVLDLYEEMSLVPDETIYTIIFNTCSHLSNDRALQIGKKLLNSMNKKFYNNDIIITSAIQMLMNFNLVNDAEYLFRKAKSKSVFTYHAMINGYSQMNQLDKCLELFNEMKSFHIIPNEVLLVSIIGVCAKTGIYSISQSIVDELSSDLKSSRTIQNTLISMWGKTGLVEKSEEIFQAMNDPDVVGYNSMINAYGLNGMGIEALNLYRTMPSDLRNEVSHICVLNACSHSGLLNESRVIFDNIPDKTGKIVTVMVDCFSRLYMFDEAETLIQDYEKTNPPLSAMYTALLSGARNSRNSIVSDRIFKRMQHLFGDEKDTLIAGSILLSNTYSSIGDRQRSEDVRLNRIKQMGNNVTVGLAWTTVNNKLIVRLC
ncbi:hypothetical protein I4U23_010424 [Adineta vaga]|nr:hypothetical protein I4U23_010424 [Adineta vaga]